MSDLIKREDAINAIYRCFALMGSVRIKAKKALEAVPSADRPQGEWIIHYRDKWMVRAECPKCHRRFEFSSRVIWKCCPMCETRMKGVYDEVR